MKFIVMIAAFLFFITLAAVRVTQKITKELSWRAAIQITFMMMLVYTFILGMAKKASQ